MRTSACPGPVRARGLRKIEEKLKGMTEAVVLYFLYGGIRELYDADSRVRNEINRWPDGRLYCLQCGPRGPALYIRKVSGGICRLASCEGKEPDLRLQFLSVSHAWPVLTGQMGVANAYARHAFSMGGEIGAGMSFARIVDLAEAYLFPKIPAKRILKRVPRREVPMVYIYLRILAGICAGHCRKERLEKSL